MTKLIDPGILKTLLDESGVISVKSNKKSWLLTCPRCGKEKKLAMFKHNGFFVCWYCKEKNGFYGSPEYFFAEVLGRNIEELRKILYGDETITGDLYLDVNYKDFYDDGEESPSIVESQPVYEVMEHPDFRDLNDKAIEYLAGRGIPLDIAQFYELRWWPAQSRVVFPIKSRGKLYGWQSRTIKPDKWMENDEILSIPKALTYHGLPKDRVIGFADRITGSHCVLTEGPIDAIKAHLCGGNIFTMGKAVSNTQLTIIARSGITEIYLGLDLDAAQESNKLVDRITNLYDGIKIYDASVKDGRDYGEMDFEEVLEVKRKAPQINKGNLFIYLKDWN